MSTTKTHDDGLGIYGNLTVEAQGQHPDLDTDTINEVAKVVLQDALNEMALPWWQHGLLSIFAPGLVQSWNEKVAQANRLFEELGCPEPGQEIIVDVELVTKLMTIMHDGFVFPLLRRMGRTPQPGVRTKHLIRSCDEIVQVQATNALVIAFGCIPREGDIVITRHAPRVA